MALTARFADEGQWRALLSALAGEYALFGPVRTTDAAGETHVAVGPVKPGDVELAPARMVDPLKAFLFRAREDLGDYFAGGEPPTPQKRAVVGATACDLASLAVMDYVFLEGEVVDPQYRDGREVTFVLSQDCTEPRAVCFCTAVGGSPHPSAGFDINLSRIDGGLVLEAGTDRGEQVLAGQSLPEATAEQVAERDRRRGEAAAAVEGQAAAFDLPAGADQLQSAVRAGVESPVWKREAEKCVECGACNFICPTCHCFLLSDLEVAASEGEGGAYRRFKNWDACQYERFARVAGGANPRPKRWERLRNRFDKKFDFFVTNTEQVACTGCGRCVEACPGKIDLRDILKELAHA